MMQLLQIFKGSLIQVIKVVMTYKNCMNLWQIINFARRLSIALRTNPLKRRASEGKDRVNHNVGLLTN